MTPTGDAAPVVVPSNGSAPSHGESLVSVVGGLGAASALTPATPTVSHVPAETTSPNGVPRDTVPTNGSGPGASHSRRAKVAGKQESAKDAERPDVPRPLNVRTLDDTASVVGSAVAALCTVWLGFYMILGWRGWTGFVICWFFLLLGYYALVTVITHPRQEMISRLVAAAVYAGFFVTAFALATTLLYTLKQGLDALQHLNFYSQDMAGVRPTDPLDKGGILHAMVGSFVMVGIACLVALPLGIGTAVYMTEVGKRGAKWVRTVVEAMIGLPDILAGLFIYVTLILGLGVERSGFAAGMALAVMMTPIIARSAEVQLRVVPGGLREAGLALGATRWRTVRHVVLPTAKVGLATALILGIARAVGETAPVLITSGASTFTNVNPVENPMNSLPLYILFAVRSGQPLYIVRGFGAAAVLLFVVLMLFVVMRFLAKDRLGKR